MPLFANLFAAFRQRFTGTYPSPLEIERACWPWDDDTLGDWPYLPREQIHSSARGR